ncbi:ABC transporter permease [Methanoregula sp.]|uniref:ABC transporter permease n=1 Tax=Methanoregula sp. TaxID=2052170 RepID=UPI003C769B58
MNLRLFAHSVLMVTEKDMRIYYYKGSVVIFGLLFPFIMFLTFFIGRNLDVTLFFPSFLGMMLFFSASSTGPLITPWEKREKTYERLVSLPVQIGSIVLGDILSGAIFGMGITAIVWIGGTVLLHLHLASPLMLLLALVMGSVTFASLGTLLASPATDTPSNIMMYSNLVRLPLIFVSGIFIPLSELGSWAWTNELSPLTYLVDLFHAAINGDAVFPPAWDVGALLLVSLAFILVAKTIQQRNLVSGR